MCLLPDGKLVAIAETKGRSLGIQFDKNENLIVCDSNKGGKLPKAYMNPLEKTRRRLLLLGNTAVFFFWVVYVTIGSKNINCLNLGDSMKCKNRSWPDVGM